MEDSTNIEFSNNPTSCPQCGGTAPLVNGVYNTIGDTIEIIKSQDFNEEELKTLTNILQRAIRLNTPAGQIRELIEKEVPKARGLNKFIDDNRGLAIILPILLSVLAIIMPYIKSPSNNDDINTEKTVDAVLSQKPKEEEIPPTKSPKRAKQSESKTKVKSLIQPAKKGLKTKKHKL